MKFLKIFKSFGIDYICKNYNIRNYTINDDGSIDVEGDVFLRRKNLSNIPLKFRNVNGDFDCSHNKLTNLKGCPISVGCSFNCSDNILINLNGGPKIVSDGFNCTYNKISSLEGSPNLIGSDFNCGNNELKSFENFPKSLKGRFYCDRNPINDVWRLFYNKNKIELFNDYDIIQNDEIVLDRLNDFLIEIGRPTINMTNYGSNKTIPVGVWISPILTW